MIKASWTAPPDPPDPPRAVYELRQNAMEPSPALAGFFFFGEGWVATMAETALIQIKTAFETMRHRAVPARRERPRRRRAADERG
jgi:hypothetical protein